MLLEKTNYKLRCIGLILITITPMLISPCPAEVLTFSNQSAWEAAVASYSTEDFEGATSDVLFGVAYQPAPSPNGDLSLHANANFSDNASIDVYPYISANAGPVNNVVVNIRFLDQGNNTNTQETLVVVLPTGISAFGFDYLNYDNQNDGTFLSIQGTNGQMVPAFSPGTQGNSQFFGVVDTGVGATITSFSFTGDPSTGSGSSAFNSFDNVRYGVASTVLASSEISIPEPASLVIFFVMGASFASIRTRQRKRFLRAPSRSWGNHNNMV